MAKSQETYSKKEKESKKLKKRKEKEEKKLERKANNNKGKSFEEMLAYVDENGNLSSTPPDPKNAPKPFIMPSITRLYPGCISCTSSSITLIGDNLSAIDWLNGLPSETIWTL